MNIQQNILGSMDTLEQIGQHSFLVPERSEQPELLDQGYGSPQDVQANLKEMWRLNHILGGIHHFTSQLFSAIESVQAPLKIADIGTGAAELPRYIAQWSDDHAMPLEIFAVDISQRNLTIAKQRSDHPRIHFIQAAADDLPFGEGEIDYFISSLFLHHLSPTQLISFLQHTYQHARRGIIMTDLIRHYFPLAAFRLIQPIFARNFLTQTDGRTSIRRAYTANELLVLAERAGLGCAKVHNHMPWRMTLRAEKSDV